MKIEFDTQASVRVHFLDWLQTCMLDYWHIHCLELSSLLRILLVKEKKLVIFMKVPLFRVQLSSFDVYGISTALPPVFHHHQPVGQRNVCYVHLVIWDTYPGHILPMMMSARSGVCIHIFWVMNNNGLDLRQILKCVEDHPDSLHFGIGWSSSMHFGFHLKSMPLLLVTHKMCKQPWDLTCIIASEDAFRTVISCLYICTSDDWN